MKGEHNIFSLQWTKQLLGWEAASDQARTWWQELESLNVSRPDLVLKLAAELLERDATIDEFFLACSYSGREGVQENLRFLDQIKQDREAADTVEEDNYWH